MPYTCTLGEKVTLDFDLTGFEHTCGFRFDPLLEDSSMVKLEALALTYENEETKQIEADRLKTNSDVDFDPVFVLSLIHILPVISFLSEKTRSTSAKSTIPAVRLLRQPCQRREKKERRLSVSPNRRQRAVTQPVR